MHNEIIKIQTSEVISDKLYFDPLLIKTFSDLTENMIKRVSASIRKKGLENFLMNNKHETYEYYTKAGIKTNIFIIEGAVYDNTEFQIAEKLAKSGQKVFL